jgi:hypothetical protein
MANLLTAFSPALAARVTLPPEVTAAVSNARNGLKQSAAYDKLKICTGPTGDAFMPEGASFDCIQKQVRHDASAFREGVRNQLHAWRAQGKKNLADLYVPELKKMVAYEARMPPEEVNKYVTKDYQWVFGATPSSPSLLTAFPSRMPVAIPTTSSTLVTLPGTVAPATDYPEEEEAMAFEVTPVDRAPVDKPIPWLLIGVGAVVVVGAGVLLTRK